MRNYLENRLESSSRNKFQKCQVEAFLSLLTAPKYSSVLEVGCGKGFFTYVGAMARKFVDIAACDVFNDLQKEEISPFVNSLVYRNIEGTSLPFGTDEFDLVFSVDVIEHVENPVGYIKEQIRVCKSGGEIIFGTPNLNRATNLFLKTTNKLKFPRSMGQDTYGEVLHLAEYTEKDFHNWFSQFQHKINQESIRIVPCWFGIMPVNAGLKKPPRLLRGLCQFWFVKIKIK